MAGASLRLRRLGVGRRALDPIKEAASGRPTGQWTDGEVAISAIWLASAIPSTYVLAAQPA
jgi:hypothetical protein